MTIVYSIGIDRNHDGGFESDGEEINAYVIDLRWRLGMAAAYDSMADFGWARIRVRNRAGEFSPERHSLPSGTVVRIQSESDGVRRTHFVGYVTRVEPDAGEQGRKEALIHLADMQTWLEESPARLPPQLDVTADQVIAQLLDQATLRRPIVGGHCIIDVAGYNLIDRARIFPGQNAPRRLAPGKTRFVHVGDWWRDSTSVRRAIADLVLSERGRFFIDREGHPAFLNRHYTLRHKELAASFDDDMSGMSYSYGDERLNRLALRMTPREIGEAGSLLWELATPQRIAQRSETLLTLRLLDDAGEPFGLLAVDDLVARFKLWLGDDHFLPGDDLRAELEQVSTTSVQVRLINRRWRDVFLTRLRLYGKALYRRAPLEIVAEDGEGMHLYGLKQMSLDLPALSDIRTATAFVNYELARRKHPRGSVRQMQLSAREHEPAALGATLFDRMRISEAQTGHRERDYFILAEEHHVYAGGARHDAIWTLEPADSTRFVIVDDSAIGDLAEALAPY